MEFVFDAPRGARRLEDGLGVGFERGNVELCLEAVGAGLLVDAPGGDRGERTQALPVGVALGEPTCVGGAALALFDPAMTGVGLDLARAGLRASGVGEEKCCVLVQAR